MITVVSTIVENAICNQFIFNDTDDAESCFVDLVINEEGEQPASDELNGAITDGVWESKTGVTICIGQPDSPNNSTVLKEIREKINGMKRK